MFVSDWMTRKVIAIDPEDSISEAIRLMKENRIKHIPVVRDDKLKGIVSDRDIKEFSPSQSTSLDIFELHYLFAKIKIREVMKTRVLTTSADTPIEEAALVMYQKGVGCLPVMDDGRLIGIISDMDIFRALVDITGASHGGHRIFMTIRDVPGSIREVADIIRKHGFNLQSILTSYEGVKDGHRDIVIRTNSEGQFSAMRAELTGAFRDVRIRKGS